MTASTPAVHSPSRSVRAGSERADGDLVRLHRYGDPEAFLEIYNRFGDMVFNLALRMSGDPDVAADCTQDVFLRVHRYLPSFRARSSLKTWIFRIALNCCRSRLGKGSRRRRVVEVAESEFLEQVEDTRRSPEERAAAHELSARVHTLIAGLKPRYREAVILRDIEGCTYKEIASILRVRVGTVRSRIARGREQLRQLLIETTEVPT